MSGASAPGDAPDLTLSSVAFARVSDGRIVSRGTARTLDYRRQGGRVAAREGVAALEPGPGTGFATLGTLHLQAGTVDGEITGKRGTARGDVRLDAARGDRARTEKLDYDGALVQTDTPVDASGPGYAVHGNGLIARTDGSSVQLLHGVRGKLQASAEGAGK